MRGSVVSVTDEQRGPYPRIKRALDVVLSAVGLLVAWPVLLVIAIAVRLTSPGPAIFLQERMGLGCQPFRLLKFRTMWLGAHANGPLVTSAGDARVTPVGRLLRKYKLDELPQLWNVLRGDMSLVGPRPQTRGYFEFYKDEYARVLNVVRPGITDFAAIYYRDEEGVLAGLGDPEEDYIRHVIPEKLRLYELYVERMSFWTDLYILAHTFLVILPGLAWVAQRGQPSVGLVALPVRGEAGAAEADPTSRAA
jgi:lipopolysaccharide/colanic/teichoic acid biosynthesis glycosyltransferase